MKIYCLKCRCVTPTKNMRRVQVGTRVQVKGVCLRCNSRKCQFVSNSNNKCRAHYTDDHLTNEDESDYSYEEDDE